MKPDPGLREEMPTTDTDKVRAPAVRRTLLPWVGGKSRSAARIIERFPPHKVYVELFCGGCAVLYKKPRSKVEIINDADQRLITLLRVARYHPDELLRELQWLTHSRVEFADALAQPGVTDIQRAARFLLVLNASFGSNVSGKPAFGYSLVLPAKFSRAFVAGIVATLRERLDRVTVECLDFEDAIRRYDSKDTLFYADPPYPCATGYAVPFTDADHVRLRDALAGANGKAAVSLNDHPRTRERYASSGWTIAPLDVPYSMGRKSRSIPPVPELLILRS